MLFKILSHRIYPLLKTITCGAIQASLRNARWYLSGNIQAVIWDLDGTLLDTTPIHIRAWERLFKKYSPEEISGFEDFYHAYINAYPKEVTIQRFFQDLDTEAIGEDFEVIFNEELTAVLRTDPESVIFESSLRLLHAFHALGIKQAIATSNGQGKILLTELNLHEIFDAIVTTKDVAKGKPAPYIFLEAAKQLNVEPTQSIVFEDASPGVIAAKAGRFFTVGINRTDYTDLEQADITVLDLSEVVITPRN